MENSSNIQPDQIIVVEGDAGFVPKAEPSDAGKVLGVVNASGDVGWVEASGGQLTQQQADWAETDPSKVTYIDNKPDLSVYATSSAVDTALAGKQDVISDLSDIRAGATAGATAVQPSALDSYATTSAMNTALAGKQDTISDLSTIRAGATAGATAVQPAALNDYATTSAMNTALAGKQDVINDLSDIRAGAAKGDTAVQPAALDSYATTSAMNTALADKQDVISDLSDIRAGAALGATAAQPSDLPSSDELLPSASSGDAGKILSVDASGNPEWITPSGGTTYSAGDGIGIDANNVISADVDGVTIGIDSTTKKIKSLQTIPSVDQTYNASSSNAQSGVAVAQAIASIPSSSYTAGEGIAITGGEISVDHDATLTAVHPTESVTATSIASVGTGYRGNAASMNVPSDVQDWMTNGSGTITIHVPGNSFKKDHNQTSGRTAKILFGHYTNAQSSWWRATEPSTTLTTTYDSVLGVDIVDEQDVVVNVPYTSWSHKPDSVPYITVQWVEDGSYTADNSSYSYFVDDTAGAPFVFTRQDASISKLSVAKPVPASTSADANKVLTVDSNGDTVWQTPTAVSVDQTYNASSTNAQSGTAVAGAIAGVKQVPASTSADENKVLTVNSSGNAVWAESTTPASKPLVAGSGITITDGPNDVSISADVDQTYDAASTDAQSGVAVASAIASVNAVPSSTSADQNKVLTVNSNGIPVWATAQGGGSSAVDYTDDAYWESVLKGYINTTTGAYAILKFNDTSFDPSQSTSITNNYTITRLSEYSENVWLFYNATVPTTSTTYYCLQDSNIPSDYEALSIAYTACSSLRVVEGTASAQHCTRIGNVFPIPDSAAYAYSAEFTVCYNLGNKLTTIGDVDATKYTNTASPVFPKFVPSGYMSDPYQAYGGPTSIRSLKLYRTFYVHMDSAFAGTKIVAAPVIYNTSSQKVTEFQYLYGGFATFRGCTELKSIDWKFGIDAYGSGSGATSQYNISEMFAGCSSLENPPSFSFSASISANMHPVNFTRMFYKCAKLKTNPTITLLYAPSSGGLKSLSALILDGMFEESGLQTYTPNVYSDNYATLGSSFEALATSTKDMFKNAKLLGFVALGFGTEMAAYVEKTDVSGMFTNCFSLHDSDALYSSVSSSVSASVVTTDAFSNAGILAPDYTTKHSQIPSSWGGTGA